MRPFFASFTATTAAIAGVVLATLSSATQYPTPAPADAGAIATDTSTIAIDTSFGTGTSVKTDTSFSGDTSRITGTEPPPPPPPPTPICDICTGRPPDIITLDVSRWDLGPTANSTADAAGEVLARLKNGKTQVFVNADVPKSRRYEIYLVEPDSGRVLEKHAVSAMKGRIDSKITTDERSFMVIVSPKSDLEAIISASDVVLSSAPPN
jgi:hypothetical protein